MRARRSRRGCRATERPDLPAGEHFVSEYARGSTATPQVVAFLCWALSLGLASRLARGTVTTGALALAAAGAVLAGYFATVTVAGELPEGVTYTTAGRLHNLGSILIFFGPLGIAWQALFLAEVRRSAHEPRA